MKFDFSIDSWLQSFKLMFFPCIHYIKFERHFDGKVWIFRLKKELVSGLDLKIRFWLFDVEFSSVHFDSK